MVRSNMSHFRAPKHKGAACRCAEAMRTEILTTVDPPHRVRVGKKLRRQARIRALTLNTAEEGLTSKKLAQRGTPS